MHDNAKNIMFYGLVEKCVYIFSDFCKICVSASKRSIKFKTFIPKNTKKIPFQNNYSVKKSLPELVV